MLSEMPLNGVLFFLVLVAMVLAPAAALVVRWRYRAAVLKLMSSKSGLVRAEPRFHAEQERASGDPTLSIETLAPSAVAVLSRPMIMFGASYFVAGMAHALVSAVIWFVLNGIDILPIRFLVLWLLFSTPAVFSALYVIGMRQLLILLGAMIWVMIVMALAATSSISGLLVLMLPILVALPVTMGLLLVNRKVGTIAPFLVLPVMLLALGAVLSLNAALIGLQIFETSLAAWGSALLSVLMGLLGGWIYLAVTARQYERSKVSELMIQHDVLWFLVSTIHALFLLGDHGLAALAMFIPFVIYRVALILFAKLSKPTGDADRLLFLRVFGFQTRQAELHRVFLNAWRRKGPVCLIGAPDVALDTIEPPELFAFVMGRLKRIFVTDSAEVRAELLKPLHCSADGLYPLEDFYCFDDTWQASVQELIGASSLVVMDLRGFNEENMGCVYEIGELFKRTPPEQLVFLINHSTDRPVLERAMQDAWRENAKPGQRGEIALWTIEGVKDLRRLFRQLRAQVQ